MFMETTNIQKHTMQSGMACWLTHVLESFGKALTLRKFRRQQVCWGWGLAPCGCGKVTIDDHPSGYKGYSLEVFDQIRSAPSGWRKCPKIHPGLRTSQWQTAQSWTATPSATGLTRHGLQPKVEAQDVVL